MAELTGITNVATQNIVSLFASMRDTDFMSVDITLGYPTVYHQRGALLGKITATGKYRDYDTTGTDGAETLAGILAEDLSSLGEDQKTNLIVSGDINRSACVSKSTIPTGPATTLLGNSINFVNQN